MADCIFCKIARKEIRSEVVRETDDVFAFRDLNPQAPTHVLLVPKKHIASVNELTAADLPLVGKLFLVAREIAAAEGHAQDGYRLVVNTGPDAGQTVFHIHLHLLSGRGFTWPPG